VLPVRYVWYSQYMSTNPFDLYEEFVHKIAKRDNLDETITQQLLTPDAVHKEVFSIKRDSGESESIEVYRVQFSNARGPYKGGIRFHPEAHLDEVKTLAALMAVKTSVVNIPMGGGKGGAVVDTKQHSAGEIEQIARGWMHSMQNVVGVDKDIPAPDVYTNSQIMSYMLDEYERLHGYSSPGVITGKPLVLGGSQGRSVATSLGGVFIIEQLCAKLHKKPPETTVAIQGFGNAGYHAARILAERGYKIIAVSDSGGGISTMHGLDIEHVQSVKQEHGSVTAVDGVEHVSNAELLELECDILIPAALGDVITSENASKIRADIIIELANGPLTKEASAMLDKDTHVVPDVLANAGGVTVSYFEWVQNRTGYYWDEDEIFTRLEKVMHAAFEDVWTTAKEESVTLREAAYIVGLRRIIESLRLRGRRT